MIGHANYLISRDNINTEEYEFFLNKIDIDIISKFICHVKNRISILDYKCEMVGIDFEYTEYISMCFMDFNYIECYFTKKSRKIKLVTLNND